MQDCGPFLDPFEYISEPARLEEDGRICLQEVSRFTKAFEDGRKLVQLTCCCIQSSGPSLKRA